VSDHFDEPMSKVEWAAIVFGIVVLCITAAVWRF
jgi:hypothetical protein